MRGKKESGSERQRERDVQDRNQFQHSHHIDVLTQIYFQQNLKNHNQLGMLFIRYHTKLIFVQKQIYIAMDTFNVRGMGYLLISLGLKCVCMRVCACIRASVSNHKGNSLIGSSPSALRANRLIDFRGILSPLIGSKTMKLSARWWIEMCT